MEIIKKAKEPHAQTEIMVVDSIEKLINRAAEL
jgi:hypothetical protein